MVEVALPSPTTTPDASEQVRAAELERLKDLFAAEQGSVAVVHGPRGVGKEHLASAMVRAAQQTCGCSAVFESRTPGAGGKSFHPFAEIVRQAMAWAEQAGASEALVDPVLQDLEPVLDNAAVGGAIPASLDSKLRFFDGVRRLLAGISARTRFIAVIHEFERADSDTLELASYLADNLFGDRRLDPGTGRPGLVLLLVRDDRTTPARARDFLLELEERGSVEMVRLVGLDLEGLKRYVHSPRFLEKLMAVSEGLPREIEEILDALPSNVEEIFERRLESLDLVSRDVLRALALSSQPASARILAQVTGQPLKDVARALSDAKKARILERRIQQGEIQFSFARRSNQETAARTTAAEQIARYHGGWADALALEPGGGGAALLAYHQLRSTEPSRGVSLAIKAAETHAVAGALEASAELLEDALPHAKGELRLAILERLCELSTLRGKPREAVRYVEQWKSELPEDARGRALLKQAELFNLSGEHDRALAALEDARSTLPEDAAIEHAAVAKEQSEALYQLGRLEAAQAAGEAGLLRLQPIDSAERARIELVNLLGKIALAAENPKRALVLFSETLALAEKAGLLREEARARVNLGLAHMRAGSLADAEDNLLAGTEKAEESNDLSHLAFGNLNLGVLAHQRGELGRAIERYRATKSLFRQLGNRTQLARVLYNLGHLYLLAGDLRRARAHCDEALRLAHAGGVERLVSFGLALDGILLGEEGDSLKSEARLREAMVHQRRSSSERPLETMVDLAQLQLRSGQIERAFETLEETTSAARESTNRRLLARLSLLRARLLIAKNEPAPALQILTSARPEIEALGERLLIRDLELAIGLALRSSGRRETARMHLGSAVELGRAVGEELPADLRASFDSARPQREVLEALRRLDAPPEAAAPAPSPSAERSIETLSGAAAPAADRAPRARPSTPPPRGRHPEWMQRYGALVGDSAKLFRVFHILDKVAGSENAVLIYGESGTGKELVAEAIHRNSPRSKGPFVKLNCAALVESLLLSELFGHERGSFTGAHQRKVGRFESAAGGTIFLDEIGDISPKTQVSLLRVLQEREFERVGGGRPIKLLARVLCATNKNLAQLVKEGTFREDLYYRLKGITIEMPPLRERPEDIVRLARHFLARYAVESGTPERRLSDEAAGMLERYSWPGNIRELENIVRSVALFAEGEAIERRDFDEYRELFEDAPALERALDGTPPVVDREPPRIEAPEPRTSFAPPPAEVRLPRPAAVPVEAEENGDDADEVPSTFFPVPPVTDDAVSGAALSDSALLMEIFKRGIPLGELKKKLQDEAIGHALKMTKGNITRAAEMLGMKRPRLSQIINANESLKQLCQGGSR